MTKGSRRGAFKPAKMTPQEVRDMCARHTTVPLWPHAAQAVGVSKDLAYSNPGDLGATKIGGRWVVPTAALARVLGIDSVPSATA